VITICDTIQKSPAYGKIGETSVGGVEIIGVDGDGYRSTFYDSFGNVQVAHHEVSADRTNWRPSMDVALRKVR
jgi:hypothetical protein